jgi:hypothetical protein
LSISDKPAVRPNFHSKLRLRAKTARQRFLETDVSPAEHQQIMDYCLKNKISVSQFLADLVLEDAATAKNRKAGLRVKPDVELTSEEYDKLELLAHLHNKSVEELIRDLIHSHLDFKRIHVESKTRLLRFYLSDREHQIVVKHLESLGVPARKYVSFLAIRFIAKSEKHRKP